MVLTFTLHYSTPYRCITQRIFTTLYYSTDLYHFAEYPNDEPVEERRRVGRGSNGSNGRKVLLPVNNKMDDVEYFSNYVGWYETCCADAENGKMPRKTEDSCYLCKDGVEFTYINKKKII